MHGLCFVFNAGGQLLPTDHRRPQLGPGRGELGPRQSHGRLQGYIKKLKLAACFLLARFYNLPFTPFLFFVSSLVLVFDSFKNLIYNNLNPGMEVWKCNFSPFREIMTER